MKSHLLLVMLLALSGIIRAQVAGTNSTVSKRLDFKENFKDLNLDPSPKTGAASRVAYSQNFRSDRTSDVGLATAKNILGAAGITIPDWVTDLANGTSFFCSDVKGDFSVNASVDVEGYYQVGSIGNAEVDIDYPIEVLIEYPEANTFGCGDEIRINTSYQILDHANQKKLQVKTPFINQEIGADLKNLSLNANIGLKAEVGFGVKFPAFCPEPCFVTLCSNKLYFDEGEKFEINLPTPNIPPLLVMCDKAFGPNATANSVLSCGINGPTPILNLVAAASQGYGVIEFPDENSVKIEDPDFPSIPGYPTLPEIEGTFRDVSKSELAYQAINQGKKLKVSGTKSSIAEAYIDLISFIDYTGKPTSLSLGSGLGEIDLGDIAPAFTVDQAMAFDFTPVVHLQINLGRSMLYSVYRQNGVFSHSSTGQIVDLLAGDYIIAQYPQHVSAPSNGGGFSFIDGQFSAKATQDYYRNIQIRFAEVKIPGILDETLVDEATPKTKFGSNEIINHTFNLAVPDRVALPNFTLDPENPIIDIPSVSIEDEINLGNGEKAIVYRVEVKNGGDVNLSNVEMPMYLEDTFGADEYNIECIVSTDLDVNLDYDGSAQPDLLAAGNILDPGQSSVVEILVRVKPAVAAVIDNGCFGTVIYDASVKAYATSPIGTRVENNYNQCTNEITGSDIIASVDLGPDALGFLSDFTVYASEDLKFYKNQITNRGHAGAGKKVKFENVSQKSSESAIIYGDVYSYYKMEIKGDSKIIIDNIQAANPIKISGKRAELTTTGAISENSTCLPVVSVPEMPYLVISTKNKIRVAKNSTMILPPGEYYEVKVEQGATLILISGTYNIRHWNVDKDYTTVKFSTTNGPIIINVDKWKTNGEYNKYVVENNSSSRDVYYNVLKGGSLKFERTLVQGNIRAARGHVSFEDNSRIEGTCYAKKITFKNGSNYIHHDYLEPLQVDELCQSAVNYYEVYDPNAVSDIKFKPQSKAADPAPESQVVSEMDIVNYPNPFLDQTRFDYQLTQAGKTKLVLMDLSGKVIATLVDQHQAAGTHSVDFNANGSMPAGIYFYSLITSTETITKKMIKINF